MIELLWYCSKRTEVVWKRVFKKYCVSKANRHSVVTSVDMKVKNYRDGLHIQCPDIVVNNKVLHSVCLDLINA